MGSCHICQCVVGAGEEVEAVVGVGIGCYAGEGVVVRAGGEVEAGIGVVAGGYAC